MLLVLSTLGVVGVGCPDSGAVLTEEPKIEEVVNRVFSQLVRNGRLAQRPPMRSLDQQF